MEPLEYATLRHEEDRFWWYRALHRLIIDRIASVAAERGETRLRILDAGCGTGGMLARAADRFGSRVELFGVDVSPLALRAAHARGVATLARGSVGALPFRDASFDLVISLDVLYHRAVVDDLAALGEFRRCLRPGGRLLLHLPAFESLRSSHDAAIHTARRYRRRPLRALLVRAGLQPRRVSYRNSVLFPALALVRRWRRRVTSDVETRGTGPPPSDVRPLPPALDRMLFGVLDAERLWLRWASLPWGLSLLAEAERPPES